MAKKKKASPKRKGGGSKLSRTEIVQVRLEPKLRFAAELGARKLRRTLSSYIEWAIEEATKRTHMIAPNDSTSAHSILESIWNPDNCTRLINLALNFPQFLTFEEENTWHLILNYSKAWAKGDQNLTLYQDNKSLRSEFMKATTEEWEQIKSLWPHFLAAGKGDEEAESFLIRKSHGIEE